MEVKVKVLDNRYNDGTWELPSFGTAFSAGVDLRAALDAPYVLYPGDSILVPTGLSMFIGTPGIVGLLFARSGLGHRHGIALGNGTGVIDADYQGPLMVSILNRSNKEFTIEPGERIAQMLFMNVVAPADLSFKVVDEFVQTERGEGGFGSTGRVYFLSLLNKQLINTSSLRWLPKYIKDDNSR